MGDDGMVVSVGDAPVRIVTMPGHTPGTLSYLFEVRDHGKAMRVAYVGGTAIPFDAGAAYYDTYIASSERMAKAASEYGATACSRITLSSTMRISKLTPPPAAGPA